LQGFSRLWRRRACVFGPSGTRLKQCVQALQIFPQLADLFPQLIDFFRGCILLLRGGRAGLLLCRKRSAGTGNAAQKEQRDGHACLQAKPECLTYFAEIAFFSHQ
jgi:hypothetical protein